MQVHVNSSKRLSFPFINIKLYISFFSLSFFLCMLGEQLASPWRRPNRSSKPAVLGLARKRSSTKTNIWQSTMQVGGSMTVIEASDTSQRPKQMSYLNSVFRVLYPKIPPYEIFINLQKRYETPTINYYVGCLPDTLQSCTLQEENAIWKQYSLGQENKNPVH